MKTLRRDPGRQTDTGAAAVEFALVVPVLVLLVFGIIQFGFTFGQYLALNNAARQGARSGVVSLNTCDKVMANVYQGSFGSLALKYPLTVTVSRSGGGGTLCAATLSPSTSPADPTLYTATYTTGASTTVGCPAGNVANALTVTASSTSAFTIPPFFFINNYTVSGKGVYQCEIG